MVINLRPPSDQSTARSSSRDAATVPSIDALSRVFSTREAIAGCASHSHEMQVNAVAAARTGLFPDANVVGLPHHARYSSAPAGDDAERRAQAHHSRSTSVPKTVVDRPGVNVSFYRAVPVNVVASVPTIRCLNSSDHGRGNDVSNVQVLPLGQSFPTSRGDLYGNHSDSCAAVPTSPRISAPCSTSGSCVVVQTPPRVNAPFSTSGSCTAVPTPSRISASCSTSGSCVVVQTPPRVNAPCSTSGSFVVVPTPSRVNAPCSASSSFAAIPTPPRISASCSTSGSCVVVQTPPRVNAPCSASSSCAAVPTPSRISASCSTSGSCVVVPTPPRISAPCSTSGSCVVVQTPPRVNASCSTSGSCVVVPTPSRVNVTCGTSDGPFVAPRISVSCGTSGSSSSVVPVSGTAQVQRTFTSTEAQTDDVAVLPAADDSTSRRRRERRERRQQRRGRPSEGLLGLPDLLNSHRPPPYAALSSGAAMGPPHQLMPPLQTVVPANGFVFQTAGGHQVPMVPGPAPVPHPAGAGFRLPFPVAGFSRGRFPEGHPKGCCGLLSWKPGSLRWFIALIALVAVCCVLVGTALGAMRPSGRDHLTVSLLMIGVGVVLVTVSGVAWRLTSQETTSTCRSMLGLGGGGGDSAASSFAPRPPPPYGRPPHPYAAMMYPEFQRRPPPPSYQASMQEYRLRLLLLDRQPGGPEAAPARAGLGGAASPPPTYRSHAGSLLRVPLSGRRDASQSEYSCPPSYRSQNSVNRHSTAHSTSPSASESERACSVVNIVGMLGDERDAVKMEAEHREMLLGGGGKSGNLVTIVQGDDSTPVIVTVSGSSQIGGHECGRGPEATSDIEILAHL